MTTWCPKPIMIQIFTTMKTSTLYNLECDFLSLFPLANSTMNNAKDTYTLHIHLKFQKCSQNLLKNWSNVFQWQRAELVLFEKVIQVLFQHLKYQTGVVFMLEALIRSNKIEFIGIFLAKTWQDANLKPNSSQLHYNPNKWPVMLLNQLWRLLNRHIRGHAEETW